MKLEFTTDAVEFFLDAFEGSRLQRLKDSILAIMLGQKDELFEKSQTPAGTGWAPLSPRTIARKEKKAAKISKSQRNTSFGSQKTLIDTGALQNSLTAIGAPNSYQSTEGNEISIGTNLPYAAAQNFGYQKIPARPFMGIGKKDNEEIQEKIVAFINKGGM